MDSVLQFGETAHKKVHYYYYQLSQAQQENYSPSASETSFVNSIVQTAPKNKTLKRLKLTFLIFSTELLMCTVPTHQSFTNNKRSVTVLVHETRKQWGRKSKGTIFGPIASNVNTKAHREKQKQDRGRHQVFTQHIHARMHAHTRMGTLTNKVPDEHIVDIFMNEI